MGEFATRHNRIDSIVTHCCRYVWLFDSSNQQPSNRVDGNTARVAARGTARLLSCPKSGRPGRLGNCVWTIMPTRVGSTTRAGRGSFCVVTRTISTTSGQIAQVIPYRSNMPAVQSCCACDGAFLPQRGGDCIALPTRRSHPQLPMCSGSRTN